MVKITQEQARILTEEELQTLRSQSIGEKGLLVVMTPSMLDKLLDSHRELLSANAELSFENMKLKEELKQAKGMLVQSEVRRITESGLLA